MNEPKREVVLPKSRRGESETSEPTHWLRSAARESGPVVRDDSMAADTLHDTNPRTTQESGGEGSPKLPKSGRGGLARLKEGEQAAKLATEAFGNQASGQSSKIKDGRMRLTVDGESAVVLGHSPYCLSLNVWLYVV